MFFFFFGGAASQASESRATVVFNTPDGAALLTWDPDHNRIGDTWMSAFLAGDPDPDAPLYEDARASARVVSAHPDLAVKARVEADEALKAEMVNQLMALATPPNPFGGATSPVRLRALIASTATLDRLLPNRSPDALKPRPVPFDLDEDATGRATTWQWRDSQRSVLIVEVTTGKVPVAGIDDMAYGIARSALAAYDSRPLPNPSRTQPLHPKATDLGDALQHLAAAIGDTDPSSQTVAQAREYLAQVRRRRRTVLDAAQFIRRLGVYHLMDPRARGDSGSLQFVLATLEAPTEDLTHAESAIEWSLDQVERAKRRQEREAEAATRAEELQVRKAADLADAARRERVSRLVEVLGAALLVPGLLLGIYGASLIEQPLPTPTSLLLTIVVAGGAAVLAGFGLRRITRHHQWAAALIGFLTVLAVAWLVLGRVVPGYSFADFAAPHWTALAVLVAVLFGWLLGWLAGLLLDRSQEPASR